jgi:hypothetical protein
MKDHDIDLDLWPEAKEAITSAWVRGCIAGFVVGACIVGLAWISATLI